MHRSTWPVRTGTAALRRGEVSQPVGVRVPGRRWPHFEGCQVVAGGIRETHRSRAGRVNQGQVQKSKLASCMQTVLENTCVQEASCFFLERPAGVRAFSSSASAVPEASTRRRASPRGQPPQSEVSACGCSTAATRLRSDSPSRIRAYSLAGREWAPAQAGRFAVRGARSALGGRLAHQLSVHARRADRRGHRKGLGHEPAVRPANEDGARESATRRPAADLR